MRQVISSRLSHINSEHLARQARDVKQALLGYFSVSFSFSFAYFSFSLLGLRVLPNHSTNRAIFRAVCGHCEARTRAYTHLAERCAGVCAARTPPAHVGKCFVRLVCGPHTNRTCARAMCPKGVAKCPKLATCPFLSLNKALPLLSLFFLAG